MNDLDEHGQGPERRDGHDVPVAAIEHQGLIGCHGRSMVAVVWPEL